VVSTKVGKGSEWLASCLAPIADFLRQSAGQPAKSMRHFILSAFRSGIPALGALFSGFSTDLLWQRHRSNTRFVGMLILLQE